MLVQLNISNFAIINKLEINFQPGLNILSGETGAGKSIIINAVNLILGGRASADLIRTGADQAVVEALFNVPEQARLRMVLREMEIACEGELVIRRTISREGRNKIVINGTLATLQMLSGIGMELISVSGQHEHQLLLRPENHIYFLDEFGGLIDRRVQLTDFFKSYGALVEEIRSLDRQIREDEQRQELARFQMNEIDSAGLQEGEDVMLEQERERLRHAHRLIEIVTESYRRIYETEGSVLTGLTVCIKDLERGAQLDPSLGRISQALSGAKVELEEAAIELRKEQGRIVIDPYRLEQVEERLQLLNRLKKKYGPTLADVTRFREELSQKIEGIEQKRELLDALRQKRIEMEKGLLSAASVLSGKRKEAAKRLEKQAEEELVRLAMGGTRFEACFHGDSGENPPARSVEELRPEGFDRVEFMLSSNIGEDLRPLSRTASGGELSRIMLALKTILARTGSVETIIFDEVDAGIGGATADVVGEKLLSLARYHQILCITHLPQIASKGRTHFLVSKTVKGKRTETAIFELRPEERVHEIARLVGGKVVSARALDHAREMLGPTASDG